MADLRLDKNSWDIYVNENFDYEFLSGIDFIEQRVKIKLRIFLGEVFLDTSFGIPWIEDIFIKNASPDVIEAVLKKAIYEIPEVIQILSFKMDYDSVSRSLSVSTTIETTEGIVVIDNETIQ